jgi:hypothetical protein
MHITYLWFNLCEEVNVGEPGGDALLAASSELHSYDKLGYNIYSVRTGCSHGSGTGMMRPSLCVDLKLLTFL